MYKLKIFYIILALILLINPAFAEDQPDIVNKPQTQSQPQTDTIVSPKDPDLKTEIVFSKPDENISITLEESLKTALENNLNIKIITAQKDSAQWQFYNRVAAFLPDFGYEYRKTRFGGTQLIGGVVPAPITETSDSSKFLGQVEVFSGFRKYFEATAARNDYRATQKNLDFTKEQVLLNTTRSYYQTLQSKLNLEILKANLEQREAQLKINQQRFEAGVGTKFDVLRAEAEAALARQEVLSANNRLRLLQAQFANIIGANVFAPYLPADEEVKPKTLIEGCLNENNAREIALRNRPDLQTLQFNVEATRARRNSGYSGYLPTVTFLGDAGGVGTSQTGLLSNKSGSIFVEWRGGDGLGLLPFTNIKSLNAQVREQKFRLIDAQRNVEQGIIDSLYSSLTAKELINATLLEVASAEESRRLALVRLESGVGIFIDVLDAQSVATRAKIRYLNAIIDYNVSQAQLLFDMGIISATSILNGLNINDELSQIPCK